MGRRIVWTEPAWNDLQTAAEFIASDSLSHAEAFVRNVKSAVESLTDFAERGQVVPELQSSTFRELLVHPYRIVYQVRPNEVEILAVIHGTRRPRR